MNTNDSATYCVQFFHPAEVAGNMPQEGGSLPVAILAPGDQNTLYARLVQAAKGGGKVLQLFFEPARSPSQMQALGITPADIVISANPYQATMDAIATEFAKIKAALNTPAARVELGVPRTAPVEIITWENIGAVALGLCRCAPTVEETLDDTDYFILGTSSSGGLLEVGAQEELKSSGQYVYRLRIRDGVSPAENDWELTDGLSTEAVAKVLREIRAESGRMIAARQPHADAESGNTELSA